MDTLVGLMYRNVSWTGKYFVGADIGPHASTDRATYTVPSGKKAIITNILIITQRNTAASAAGFFTAFVSHTPSGGSFFHIARTRSNTNTVGLGDTDRRSMYYPLRSGDTVTITTNDSSTGGTVNYYIYVSIWEYE